MPPVSEMEMAAPEGGSTGGLTRADCLCPVCLEIFLEPVTLPCSHTFCKPCFLETVDKANLCCPLCRKRVSTWARINGRNKTLVNDELWQRVQAEFPMQCQRRLSGQEEEEDGNILVPGPKVSLPGEVRREYEDQISKILEEKRALEEAERKASEEYIQCLLADEKERLEEERRRQEETQLENDNKLARLLSQELNPRPESQNITWTNDITPAKKKRNTNAGDIEKFLSPIPQRHNSNSETSPTSSFMANKENILHSESKPWSSKEPAEQTMPLLEFYPESYRMPCEASTSSERMAYHLTVPSGNSLACTPLHGTPKRGVTSAKRKSCDIEGPNEGKADVVVSKLLCPSSSSSRHAADRGEVALVDLGEKALLLQELAQREKVLFSRMQQEQEDRQLAFQLQRQLDREEAVRVVDRSKGSSDQYQLRQKPDSSSRPEGSGRSRASRGRSHTSTENRNTVERRQLSGPSSTTNKGERSSTISSAAASTSKPLKKSSKQATLTEMFPSLGS
ncbi:E3 ubiquitin-protein ligase rnf168 [Oncorhynchus mykiss]|uniref:RING-type E3 ubiquitin transferase n=1 Tax=Oncorhynchus mykiss TaxID=8022 RepID=A0A8C7UM33_ONCMY|nr:E3 ubiquitin-protein ligase rnf168 [Oncorhynchus mykiss]